MMFEFFVQCLIQFFFDLFQCLRGFLALDALNHDMSVGILHETNLNHVLAMSDDRGNFKEGGHLTGVVAEEVVHSSLKTGNVTNAVPHFGNGLIADLIVNQRNIRLEQRGDYHRTRIGQPIVFVINIDYIRIVVNDVLRAVEKLQHAGTGFGAAVRIDNAISQNLLE